MSNMVARVLQKLSSVCYIFILPNTHGSRFLLPELVEQVKPEVAVISVGYRNNFGHPAPSTMDMLYRAGARVYRTDQNGAVIIKTDGYSLDVKTGKVNK